MKTILFISCVTCWLGAYDLLSYLAELSQPAQNLCLNLSEGQDFGAELKSALLCGRPPLSDSSLRVQLLRHSMIHLLVISGLHLMIIVRSLGWSLLLVPEKLAGFLLILLTLTFVALAGSGAPLIRALASLLLIHLCRRCNLQLSPLRLCALAGLSCLALSPAWLDSYSFIFSWLAATALALTSELKLRGALWACTMVYLLLALPLSGWGIPHPYSILSNALLAAPLGFVLLIGAFMSFCLPSLQDLYTGLAHRLTDLMSQLGGPLEPLAPIAQVSPQSLGLYLLAIYLGYEVMSLQRSQEKRSCR